jgi:CMP-N,N'-diacetyllegionaminic acid synthase
MSPPVKILGFVGARGGSKGLPGKNIRDFHGKPLMVWTLEALQQSSHINEVLLSTDDPLIAQTARDWGFEVPFLRPKNLATDQAGIAEAILHAVNWLGEHRQQHFDYLLLAQPTSPLRTVKHIDEAIEQYFNNKKHDEETLVSVVPAPPKTGWLSHKTTEGYLEFTFAKGECQPRQRQALPQWYYPNGAIYLAPLKNFKGDFYSQQTQMYIMPESCSFDIDSLEDFKQAWTMKKSNESLG